MTMMQSPIQRELSLPRPPRRPPSPPQQLTFHVARDTEEIELAWRLVYQSYLDRGLIGENVHHMYTVMPAVHARSAVMYGRCGSALVSTITACLDQPGGLPLDDACPLEMYRLRCQGRRLIEFGLLAERRHAIQRSLPALLELMRQAFYYAVYCRATDIVVGVHPRHVGFYRRYLAFEPFGDMTTCSRVRDHPMVPIRLNIGRELQRDPLPRGLSYFRDNPQRKSVYRERAPLGPSAFSFYSSVAGYLRSLQPLPWRQALPADRVRRPKERAA